MPPFSATGARIHAVAAWQRVVAKVTVWAYSCHMMIDKTPPEPSARVTWRGSHASALLLADYVNLIDSVDYRAGRWVATADVDITTTTYGPVVDPVRRTIAVCTVDAYDGQHLLHDGDTLVQINDGWTVEAQQ